MGVTRLVFVTPLEHFQQEVETREHTVFPGSLMIFGMIECAKLLQNGDEKYKSEYYMFADPLFHPSLTEKKTLPTSSNQISIWEANS